ncbi:MAG: hypothetical protein Q4D71_03240 [Oscillospiraceae bacterium]|nr:hypothetical protein [Oscillospiraceae bacterium]MDO5137454.1 hypothetical protein [Oscillospiraceae bacterium]
MAKNYTKQQVEFMNAAGLLLDPDAGCYFGRRGEYSMLLRLISNQYVLSVSVAKDGNTPNPADFQVAAQECKAIQSCNIQGYRVNFFLNGGVAKKKVLENISQATTYIPYFLQQSGYSNVCESTGEAMLTDCYMVGGTPLMLSERAYAALAQHATTVAHADDDKEENFVAGAVGAFLGALAGAVAIILFSQLGLVSALSGVIMGVCTIKLYEKFAGKMSTRGVVICAIMMILMVYLGDRFDWAIVVNREAGIGLFEAFRDIPYYLQYDYIDKGSYFSNIFMEYIFSALGAVPQIVTSIRGKKIAGTSRKMAGLPVATQ